MTKEIELQIHRCDFILNLTEKPIEEFGMNLGENDAVLQPNDLQLTMYKEVCGFNIHPEDEKTRKDQFKNITRTVCEVYMNLVYEQYLRLIEKYRKEHDIPYYIARSICDDVSDTRVVIIDTSMIKHNDTLMAILSLFTKELDVIPVDIGFVKPGLSLKEIVNGIGDFINKHGDDEHTGIGLLDRVNEEVGKSDIVTIETKQ